MNKLANVVILPLMAMFFLFTHSEDVFSRGGGRGGGFGGGGGAYRSAGSYHSPSMSSSAPSRSSVSNARTGQTTRETSRPASPSSRKTSSASPGQSKQNISQPTGSKVQNKMSTASGNRPTQGQLQQFLNMPQQGGAGISDLGKVGVGAAAGALGFAGAKELLGSRGQSGDRPTVADRTDSRDRPASGDRTQVGTLPAERPGSGVRQSLGDRASNMERPTHLPSRPNADQIRQNMQNRYDNLFTPQWWKDHPQMAQAYWQNFGKYQYGYNHWWRPAAWGALAGWVAGSSWSSPAYYDYGEGVYYEDEQVYMNGKPVASSDEYYDQAKELTTAAASTNSANAEWLPLGVFAVSRDQASDSNVILQLAVDKNGIIAGTYYNTSTEVGRPVKGKVDQKTQRAVWAFNDGKNTDIIMETGIFNLTQDQTEALIHFGKDKTQQCLLVRLDPPKNDQGESQASK